MSGLGPERIAGVDEVGRGPLAGPVLAAAVILNPGNPIADLADSKTINAKKRIRLAAEIKLKALAWAIGRAEVAEIDRINILQASLLAMRRAVLGLQSRPVKVLVDGNRCPDLPYRVEAVVGGDASVQAISAASILAKVARDEEMLAHDRSYPQYKFARHKGYATREHLACLRKFGASPIHRRTFRPVWELVEGVQSELPFGQAEQRRERNGDKLPS